LPDGLPCAGLKFKKPSTSRAAPNGFFHARRRLGTAVTGAPSPSTTPVSRHPPSLHGRGRTSPHVFSGPTGMGLGWVYTYTDWWAIAVPAPLTRTPKPACNRRSSDIWLLRGLCGATQRPRFHTKPPRTAICRTASTVSSPGLGQPSGRCPSFWCAWCRRAPAPPATHVHDSRTSVTVNHMGYERRHARHVLEGEDGRADIFAPFRARSGGHLPLRVPTTITLSRTLEAHAQWSIGQRPWSSVRFTCGSRAVV
jgi:hypothetical protein